MEFEPDDAMEILGRTPAVVGALLGGLGDQWVFSNYGDKTFSPFDVVGHLIHGERTDWIARAKIILAHGEQQPFEPFDRFAQIADNQGKSLAELLSTFDELRAVNLQTLRGMSLTRQQLDLRGVHPALGTVSMRALLAAWVVHDLNHIAQIAKALAHQYRDAVGPWQSYMTILKQPALAS